MKKQKKYLMIELGEGNEIFLQIMLKGNSKENL